MSNGGELFAGCVSLCRRLHHFGHVRQLAQDNCRTPMNRLTVGKAAKENGIRRRTLQRWVRAGASSRAPDGTVDPHEVAYCVGLRQTSDRRRGPKPGHVQLALRLGKTRTGRRLTDFQRMDIVFRHLKAIDDPVVLGFVADQVHNVFAERMNTERTKAVKMGAAMARYIKENPAPTSSRVTSSAASVPAQ